MMLEMMLLALKLLGECGFGRNDQRELGCGLQMWLGMWLTTVGAACVVWRCCALFSLINV